MSHFSRLSSELTVTDTIIQDAKGLSDINRQLLRQRGAVGYPAPRLHEASKKLMSMASVVSKLKSLPKTEEDDAVPGTSVSVKQLEQRLVQLEQELERKLGHKIEQALLQAVLSKNVQ